jgi:nucleotide-binding universal stress UspA family protein
MFDRILVALDGLEKNSAVVEAGIKLAKMINAKIGILIQQFIQCECR